MTGALQTFLAVLFVFGLLIAGHELGHFTIAKLSGVKVLEFSLGMGPKLFGFKGKETTYSLRILPIGGYVKMLGEEDESSDPRAFCNKNPWVRIPIIIAGAFMNFVIAIVLFSIVFLNNGVAVKPIIGGIVEGSPAAAQKLMANDKIMYFNNEKVDTWNEFIKLMKKNQDKEFKLVIERNGSIQNKIIKPVYSKEQQKYLIGVGPVLEKGHLIESIKSSFNETFLSIKQMYGFLGNLFRGKANLKDVGGPVAIIKLSGEAARHGIIMLLYFAAFLSINLGVFNLLPFPALDGGWVVILLIEGISRRKIDENKLGVINLIGFTILIGFAILVTFKDIMKLNLF